jgi:hypothetical protein
VGTDLCFHNGDTYLVIVDYTTDYIEVEKLVDQSAAGVIQACKKVFARHGRPVLGHSDNGSQHTSAEFKVFAREWCFEHTVSSPYNPQSNGKAESAVKIVKKILKTSTDPMKGLLEWRASPSRDFASPSERLFSRRIKTLVPIGDSQLEPKVTRLEEVQQQRKKRQIRMQQEYDKSVRDLPELHAGQPVMLRTVNDRTEKWKEATTLEKLSNRSYLLDKGDGVVRRNRQMIRVRLDPDNSRRQSREHISRNNEHPQKSARKNYGRKESDLQESNQTTVAKSTSFGRVSRKPGYLEDYE